MMFNIVYIYIYNKFVGPAGHQPPKAIMRGRIREQCTERPGGPSSLHNSVIRVDFPHPFLATQGYPQWMDG